VNNEERQQLVNQNNVVRAQYRTTFASEGGVHFLRSLEEMVLSYRLQAKTKTDPHERVLLHDKADEVGHVITFISEKLAP
jgi:hypothetical protein